MRKVGSYLCNLEVRENLGKNSFLRVKRIIESDSRAITLSRRGILEKAKIRLTTKEGRRSTSMRILLTIFIKML